MITKFQRLITDAPLQLEDVLQTAMDDWENDLSWARDHGLVSPTATSLNYESFYRSIFELVDTWTETAEEAEYVLMAQKLLSGVAHEAAGGGGMRWKSDAEISYDGYFEQHIKEEGEEKEEGDAEKGELEPSQKDTEGSDDEDLGPSAPKPLLAHARTEENHRRKRKKKRGAAPAVMPLKKILARIAEV
jgi:hypothetical protein